MSEDLHTHDVVEKYKLNNFLNIQIYLKNDTLHEYILEYFFKLTMFLTSIIITQISRRFHKRYHCTCHINTWFQCRKRRKKGISSTKNRKYFVVLLRI